MRKNPVFALVVSITLLAALGATASEWGVVRYARSQTNIRAARTTESPVVGRLAAGDSIRADFLKDNWFAVFPTNAIERDESASLGYVRAPLLDPAPPQHHSAPSAQANELVEFEIVDREDVSYVGTSRMSFRVVMKVDRIPAESMLRTLAQHIWENGNKGWKEFTIFLYLPNMDTQSVAYSVAEFSPKGMLSLSVNKFSLLGTEWVE